MRFSSVLVLENFIFLPQPSSIVYPIDKNLGVWTLYI